MLTVLIRPPTLSSKNDAFQGPIPPLGLAYVAASLEKAGFSVQVVDAVGEAMDKFKLLEDFPDILKNGLDHEEILQRIPLEAKLIGISCMFSQDWPPIRSLFNLIRSHFPNATLVAGGEHVTSCPEYVLKDCPSIDCCVLGEGEETIVDLAQSVKKKGAIEEIPGLAFRKNKVTVRTKPRERIRQIASISWPAWHLFPLEIYHKQKAMFGVDLGVSMPILASRGCPYQCTFCSSPIMWTTRWEARPPKELLEEIKFYTEKYKATNFDFYDLTAIIRKDWLIEFSQLLIDEKVDITWQLPVGTRSEAIDHEVTKLLYDSGCRYVCYSPESGSVEILKLIKKKIKKNRVLDSIRSALANKMMVKVQIILGFPGETLKHVLETYGFIVRLAILGVHETVIYNFSPYPGSELFDQLREKGVVDLNDDYFYGLTRFSDPGRYTSFSDFISDRLLAFLTLFSSMIFFGLSFLFRPIRLLNLFRSIINGKPVTRYEKALQNFLKRRDVFNKCTNSSPPPY